MAKSIPTKRDIQIAEELRDMAEQDMDNSKSEGQYRDAQANYDFYTEKIETFKKERKAAGRKS